ncbi:MAG: hypothetical protein J6M66_05505 [Lachnospiraceae bacterium]|nr:hypothetical protein [Lachnospiraceae bacterium]
MRRTVETVLIVRIGSKENCLGYRVLAELRSLRIWQEDESTVMFFLAIMVEYRLREGRYF